MAMRDFSLELERGPASDREVGPRLRGGRHPSCRPRVGRARGDAVADHRRGGARSASTLSTSSPTCFADPTGLLLPLVNEELAGATPASLSRILGSTLGVAGIVANGTPEQFGRMGAAVLRHTGRPQARGFLRLGSRCRLRRQQPEDPRRYDEASDTWTLNGTKTWITNGGIADVHVVVASVDPDSERVARRASSCRPGHTGLSMGQKFKKMGIRASHTAEVVLKDVKVPGIMPPRWQGPARRAPRPCPRGEARTRRLRRRWRPSRPPVPAVGGPGGRHRPRRLRVLARLRQGTARPSAGRSSRTRASPSSSPT